jgi:2-succinyl-5-enolpyruvyl-6-hydroxy-3-cyclohexene-1-carboxylate synthase
VVATWPDPELILHFGATPTSKNLAEYLAARPDTRHTAVTSTGTWHDDGHTLSDLIWAEPEAWCRVVTAQLGSESRNLADTTWLARFQQAEQRAWDVFDRTRREQDFEGSILTDIVEVLPTEALLYVSNSLPVRHLDQFTRPTEKNIRILANRGASGIDGTISSALGAAAAAKLPLVLVTGDLAFYHDLNGLLALQRCAVKVTIVLINNDGGGIFHRLPVADFDPPFTELFVTPHGLDFEPVVRMFGAEFAAVTTRTEFRRVLQASIGADISTVIELRTDASQHEHIRRELGKKVASQLATRGDFGAMC